MQNLSINDVSSIMASGNYGVSYEPIIDIKNMNIVAYEALSRFMYKDKNVTPDIFFKTIHENMNLFFYVESVLKKFQLKHRVIDKKLFINLDPDICIHENQIEFWVGLFQKHEDITIEIIENSDEESVEDIEHFIEWMDMYKLSYAYDDFGKPNSLFFSSLLEKSNYIKFDIHFLRSIKTQSSYIEILIGMVKYAKANFKYTILEGVETQKDLQIAKSAGVDYIQGYLFEDQFISIWNKENI
ncbi:MAG: EAL domain-containing protein (putative c-di-GMP-specific phosphodiesterase class I) [Sulfurimonas sp.]|jgi:EAL domain-containing protein (putative c-di-GMP-specific phosphodiesterase class I)|uniref:EAL domain-containing protein n=1 Tax=Sulfurimonas sp. TaxID=2022749 RepID=UPI0039E4787D